MSAKNGKYAVRIKCKSGLILTSSVDSNRVIGNVKSWLLQRVHVMYKKKNAKNFYSFAFDVVELIKSSI